jgi:hypothetical protein
LNQSQRNDKHGDTLSSALHATFSTSRARGSHLEEFSGS